MSHDLSPMRRPACAAAGLCLLMAAGGLQAQGLDELLLHGHRQPASGSIWLPPDGKRRDVGRIDVEGMPTYISRGLGVYRPPVRFRCPPEVTLVTLRAGKMQRAMR